MIRLLKYSDAAGEIQLHDFRDDHKSGSLPRYAILSHTWGDQEVSFAELKSGIGKEKAGYEKIRFCVEQAAKDGFEYSWVDTCCIDKSNSVELQAAINAMFRWYQRAAKCYVFLSDVSVPDEVSEPAEFQITWMISFEQSRWFTRGWTLQELLAPAIVEFYSKEGKLLGTKMSLEQEICEITALPTKALRQPRLSGFSVEERFRWTASRSTTEPEDRAYCLFGIFGVFLPLIYNEGEEHALGRLRAEITRREGADKLSVNDNATSAPRKRIQSSVSNTWNNDRGSRVANQVGVQKVYGGQHQSL